MLGGAMIFGWIFWIAIIVAIIWLVAWKWHLTRDTRKRTKARHTAFAPGSVSTSLTQIRYNV